MDVSIIITTYNYDEYIEECINSCLNQENSILQHEVIVVDDGSSDNTEKILNHLSGKSLIKYRINNAGIEAASNYGFGKAKGRYIVRVDADDRLLPNYLQCIQQYFEQDIDFYYPDYEVINNQGKVISEMILPAFDPDEIRKRGDFLATGTLYSANILKTFGYYSETKKNSGLENYDLILRMIDAGKIGKHIPEKLFCYRRHNLNISESKKENIIIYGNELFKRMGLGIYKTNKYHPYNPTIT